MIGPAPAMNDTTRSIMTFLVAAIGCCAVASGVDVRFVLFWAIFGLMTGLAAFIDATIKGSFVKEAFQSGAYNIIFGGIPVIICPICMLTPIYFAYKLYQDSVSASESSVTMA